jgi:Fibronectin type III domain
MASPTTPSFIEVSTRYDQVFFNWNQAGNSPSSYTITLTPEGQTPYVYVFPAEYPNLSSYFAPNTNQGRWALTASIFATNTNGTSGTSVTSVNDIGYGMQLWLDAYDNSFSDAGYSQIGNTGFNYMNRIYDKSGWQNDAYTTPGCNNPVRFTAFGDTAENDVGGFMRRRYNPQFSSLSNLPAFGFRGRFGGPGDQGPYGNDSMDIQLDLYNRDLNTFIVIRDINDGVSFGSYDSSDVGLYAYGGGYGNVGLLNGANVHGTYGNPTTQGSAGYLDARDGQLSKANKHFVLMEINAGSGGGGTFTYFASNAYPTQQKYYLQYGLSPQNSPTNVRIGNVHINGRTNGETTSFLLLEYIVYSRNLNGAERLQVEGYLRRKWQLPYILYDGHPYLTNEYQFNILPPPSRGRPEATTSASISSINEIIATSCNVGTDVSTIIGNLGANFTLPSWNGVYGTTNPPGIAITSLSQPTQGNWQVTNNGGATWCNMLNQVNATIGTNVPSGYNTFLVLSGTNCRIRFVPTTITSHTGTPANNYSASPYSISFVAWDGLRAPSGSIYRCRNSTGPSLSFGSQTQNLQVTVTKTPDAPILNNSRVVTLTGINQGTTSYNGNSVQEIVDSLPTEATGNNLYSGGDYIPSNPENLPRGIAVYDNDETNGTWQYSLDSGTTWQSFNDVGANNGTHILFNPTVRIRFIPNTGWFGTARIFFRAWDTRQPSDFAFLTTSITNVTGSNGARITSIGGLTANSINANFGPYSSGTASARITVSHVAPTLSSANPSIRFSSILENNNSNALNQHLNYNSNGFAVPTIISLISTIFTVGDNYDTKNIAIYNVNNLNGFNTYGKWQWTSNSGSTWGDITGGTTNALFLLKNDPAVFIRWLPTTITNRTGSPNYAHYDNISLQFYAWDGRTSNNPTDFRATGSYGTSGVLFGGSNPISADTGYFYINVLRIPDAPNLTTGTYIMSSIQQNTFNEPGENVRTMITSYIGGSWTWCNSYQDPIQDYGLAIFCADYNNGDWQFSWNSGSTWNSFNRGYVIQGTTTTTNNTGNHLLLNQSPSTFIRFVPNVGFNGTAGFCFRAWDCRMYGSSNYSSANYFGLAAAAVGGFTPFSSNAATFIKTTSHLAPIIIGNPSLAFPLAKENVNFNYMPDSGTTYTAPYDNFYTSSFAFSVDQILSSMSSFYVAQNPAYDVYGLAFSNPTATTGTTLGYWQYSQNPGTWTNMGANNMYVFQKGNNYWIRFRPTQISSRANYNTVGNPLVYVYAFDGRSPTNTNNSVAPTTNTLTAPPTAVGGSSPYSQNYMSFTAEVRQAPDAPGLNSGKIYTMTQVSQNRQDNTSNSGDTIQSIIDNLGGDFFFSNAGPVWNQGKGIAIYARDNTNGTWQWSKDRVTWEDINTSQGTALNTTPTNGHLYLGPNVFIRFRPTIGYFGTASCFYRAWDLRSLPNTLLSTGTLTTALASYGGFNPLSLNSNTITVTVFHTAPTLNNNRTVDALTTYEDYNTGSNSYFTVSNLVSTLIGLGDYVRYDSTNDATGIAVWGQDSGFGTWWYTINNGASWTSFSGAATNNTWLFKSSDTWITFTATANSNSYLYGIYPQLYFYAWDTRGVNTTTFPASGSRSNMAQGTGGQTPFSGGSAYARITISSVNDPPVRTSAGTSATLNAPNGANQPTEYGFDTYINNVTLTDVDYNPTSGAQSYTAVALSGYTTAQGTWYWSRDNRQTWIPIYPSQGQAYHMNRSGNFWFMFVPYGMNSSGSGNSLVANFWDMTNEFVVPPEERGNSNSISTLQYIGNINEYPTTAGTTPSPYSVGQYTLNISPTSISPNTRVAPKLWPNSVNNNYYITTLPVTLLPEIARNIPANNVVGDTIDNLLTQIATRYIPFQNGDGRGMGFFNPDNSKGEWFYSIDNGNNWLSTSVLGLNDGKILKLNGSHRVKFVPKYNQYGNIGFQFYAWYSQETTTTPIGSGSITSTIDSFNSVFSRNWNQSGYVVAPVLNIPNAPFLTSLVAPLSPIPQDSINPPGDSISSIISYLLINGAYTPDEGSSDGLAIYGAANNNGYWQFSLNNGASWTTISGLTTNQFGNHLLLASANGNSLIRFIPNNAFIGTATLSYRIWDTRSNASGTYVNNPQVGGVTPFSAGVATAAIQVTFSNYSPIISGNYTFPSIYQPDPSTTVTTQTLLNGYIVTDQNDGYTGVIRGMAVIAAPSTLGTWYYSIDNGDTYTPFSTISTNNALHLNRATSNVLRFIPSSISTFGSTFLQFCAWDQTNGLTSGTFSLISSFGSGSPYSINQPTPLISVFLPPSPPYDLTANPANSQTTLRWSTPSVIGGTRLSQYNIYNSNGSQIATANGNSALISGAANFFPNVYTIKAVNEGNLLSPDSSNITSYYTIPPSAPFNVSQVYDVLSYNITLSWSTPNMIGSQFISTYIITENNIELGQTSTNRISITSLPYVQHLYRIRAINDAGKTSSDSSAYIFFYTTPPGAPEQLTYSYDPISANLTLTWEAPPDVGSQLPPRYDLFAEDPVLIGTTFYTYFNYQIMPYEPYTFLATTTNSFGSTSPFSDPLFVYFVLPPTPPVLSSGIYSITTSSVMLEWTVPDIIGSAQISTYTVKNSVGSTIVDTTNISSLISTVRPYVQNWYHVIAKNDAQLSSDPSNSVLVYYTEPPTPPTNLQVINANTQVTLKWTPPTVIGAQSVYYSIYDVSSGTPGTLIGTTSAPIFIINNLINDRDPPYLFRVIATNDAGYQSEFSATVTGTPFLSPEPPQNISTTYDPIQKIGFFYWNYPLFTGGPGRYIKHYTVYDPYTLTPIISTNSEGVTATSFAPSSINISSLQNYVQYYFTLTATNDVGNESAYSQTLSIYYITNPDPPAPETTIANYNPFQQRTTLSWIQPGVIGSMNMSNYFIYEGSTMILSTQYTTAQFSTPLYTKRFYNLYSFNDVGLSSIYSTTTIIYYTIPPFAPSTLQNTFDVLTSTATLTWSTPTFIGASSILTYRLFTLNNTLVLSTTSNTAYVSTLAKYTPYTYFVTAVNDDNKSSPPSQTTTVYYVGEPTPPRNFTASLDTTVGGVFFSWAAPSEAGSFTISEYSIFDSLNNTKLFSTPNTYYTFSTFTSFRNYTFYAIAKNDVGSNSLGSLSTTLLVQFAPSPPTDLIASPGNTIATLTWSTPTLIGANYLTQYTIYDRGTNSIVGTTTPPTRTITLTSVPNFIPQKYSVTATNDIGLESDYSLSSVSFYRAIPPQPVDLTSTVNSGSVTIGWSPVPLSIYEYILYYSVYNETTAQLIGNTTNTFLTFAQNNYQRYSYFVNATTDGLLTSANSSTVNAYFTLQPSSPVLSVSSFTRNTAELKWTFPNFIGAERIDSYSLFNAETTPPTFIATYASSILSTTLTNLDPYNRHFFYLTVANDGNKSNQSQTVEVYFTEPPTIPIGISSVFETVGGIRNANLTWQPPISTGSEFLSYYSLYTSSLEQINTSPITTLSYTLPIPYSYAKLYYFLTATNDVPLTSQSTLFILYDAATPAPPTNLSTTTEFNETLLYWSTPNFIGSEFISSYGIYNSSGQLLQITSGSSLSTLVTTIPYRRNYLQMKTFNDGGLSSIYSESTIAYFTSFPSSPSNLTTTSLSFSSIVRWSTPVVIGSEFLSSLVFYDLTTTPIRLFPVNTASTSYTFTNIQNYKRFFFGIQAFNDVPLSSVMSQSTLHYFTEPPITVPSTSILVGDKRLTLNWSTPSFFGAETIKSYVINFFVGNVVATSTTSDTFTYTFSTLTNFSTYKYTIQAQNDANLLSPTTAVLEAFPFALPSTPLNPVIMNSNSSIALFWSTPSYDGGAPIQRYEIWNSNSGAFSLQYTTTFSSFYISTNLSIENLYSYKIAARNTQGLGDFTSTLQIFYATNPTPPLLVNGVIGVGTVTLNWDPPSLTGGSFITAYNIYDATTGALLGTATVTPGGPNTFNLSGLPPNIPIRIYITAVNNRGLESPPSGVTTYVPLPTNPLTNPNYATSISNITLYPPLASMMQSILQAPNSEELAIYTLEQILRNPAILEDVSGTPVGGTPTFYTSIQRSLQIIYNTALLMTDTDPQSTFVQLGVKILIKNANNSNSSLTPVALQQLLSTFITNISVEASSSYQAIPGRVDLTIRGIVQGILEYTSLDELTQVATLIQFGNSTTIPNKVSTFDELTLQRPQRLYRMTSSLSQLIINSLQPNNVAGQLQSAPSINVLIPSTSLFINLEGSFLNVPIYIPLVPDLVYTLQYQGGGNIPIRFNSTTQQPESAGAILPLQTILVISGQDFKLIGYGSVALLYLPKLALDFGNNTRVIFPALTAGERTNRMHLKTIYINDRVMTFFEVPRNTITADTSGEYITDTLQGGVYYYEDNPS